MNRADVLARNLEANATRLGNLAERLPQIDELLRTWSAGTRSTGTGPRSRGTHSDPTAAAVGKRDPFTHDRRRIAELVRKVDRATAELVSIAVNVLAPTPPPQPDRALPRCANMHGCPADAYADPGRAGRCEACYRARLRNGRDRRQQT